MKNYFRRILLVTGMMFLFLTSCQQELDIIEEGTVEENLAAESLLVNLMKSSSSDIGYRDDVIDRLTCGRLKLPVTVEVNGVTLVINSEEDIQKVRDILNELDEDRDIVHLVFPVTVIMRNYTQVVVENKEQLDELRAECENSDDEKRAIECIDFVYPVTMLTYNSNNETIGRVEINSDAEMFLFLSELRDGIKVSIKFPIVVELANGERLEIRNNESLREAISKARELCNDDDGSIDQIPFKGRLVEGKWYINALVGESNGLYCELAGFEFKFNSEGGVRAVKGDVVVEGRWKLGADDCRLRLMFDFEGDSNLAKVLNSRWFLFRNRIGYFKVTDEKWDFENAVVFGREKRECKTEADANAIADFLVSKSWLVAKYVDDGVTETQNYSNYILKFAADGTFTASNDQTINGQWSTAISASGDLILNLDFGDGELFDELTDNWNVVNFAEARIEMKDYNDTDDNTEGYDHLVLEGF